MDLNIDVSLTYALGAERLALVAVEAARCDGQAVMEDRLEVGDAALLELAGEGGIGRRKWVRVHGDMMNLSYSSQVRIFRPPVRLEYLDPEPLDALPAEAVSFLRPSRFCQSDQLEGFAHKRFGHVTGGEKILAIADWIAKKLEYVSGHSDGATTLLDTFASRKGVCRDYAHVLCGSARASLRHAMSRPTEPRSIHPTFMPLSRSG